MVLGQTAEADATSFEHPVQPTAAMAETPGPNMRSTPTTSIAAVAVLLLAAAAASASGVLAPAAAAAAAPTARDDTPGGTSPLADSVTFTAPNGIRLAATRLPAAAADGTEGSSAAADWLYYWHPNATDPEAVVEVRTRPVWPVLVLDSSQSMYQYGYSEPSYSAVVSAALTLNALGDAQKHATQGVNVVRPASLVTFSSGGARQATLFLKDHTDHTQTRQELEAKVRGTAVLGATHIEEAFEKIRSILDSPGTEGTDVPIVLLTDGEFNGRVSSEESWAPHVVKLRALADAKDLRVTLRVLGLARDSLVQVQAMGRAFTAAGIPFAYNTMSGVADMSDAFAAAARSAMVLSGQGEASLAAKPDAENAAAPTAAFTVHQGQPVISAMSPDSFALGSATAAAAAVKPWDAAPLVAPEYFNEETAGDARARHNAVAAAMRFFVDATRCTGRLRSQAVEFGAAADVSEAAQKAVEAASDSVAVFGRRAAEVLAPFTVVRRRCGDGALGPAVCRDADELVNDQSAVVGWVQTALAELSVSRNALRAASDASRSRKARFEESNNRAGDVAFAEAAANATLEAALATATESVSETASASRSATGTQTLSASDVVRALVDNL